MKITVDGLAWLPLDNLTGTQLHSLKRRLTVVDVDVFDRHRDAMLVRAYVEDRERGLLGIPRGFLYSNLTKDHQIVEDVSPGGDWPAHTKGGLYPWAKAQSKDPGELTLVDAMSGDSTGMFSVEDQRRGFEAVMARMGARECAGGMVSFASGWDSVKLCLALVRTLKMRTLVLCSKEMAFARWETLIGRYLPDARVGFVDQDRVEHKDCHITLSTAMYFDEALKKGRVKGGEFGFVVSDQVDRMRPILWSSVMSRLSGAKRLGIASKSFSPTGRSRLFSYHLGGWLFSGSGVGLVPKVRRVWSKWRLKGVSWANPQYMSKSSVLDMMCASSIYNQHVAEQVIQALGADRRVLVFSERLKHLKLIKSLIEARWSGRPLYTDYLIAGMADGEMVRASNADVIFARYSQTGEIPDTPAVDTVVLATPIRSPGLAIERALDPYPEKKDPIVVDMRCDTIPVCKEYGTERDKFYRRVYKEKRGT